jgi:prepilin-type N-terminal cleavage/methylation domain-containing protein
MTTKRRGTRPAFTLIELLVVIGIILVLAAAGYYLLPPLATNNNRIRALDQLQQFLLTARQRARRDQLGTGIRLILDSTVSYGTGTPTGVTTVQLVPRIAYIQQADPFTQNSNVLTPGSPTGCNTTAGATTVTFTNQDILGPAAGTNPFDPTVALVQPGDYLEVPPGLGLHQIVPPLPTTSTGTVNLFSSVPTTNSNSAFVIHRQPRLLQGEDVKQMNADLVVDLSLGSSGLVFSKNVPSYTVGGSTYYEILFGPNGGVIGQSTSGGKIILYVRDNSAVNQPAPPVLIVINTRTGAVGAYDVASGADPNLFTEDGRSGGM